MNKIAIPTLLVATIMVAGMFAFAPVEQASTVHTTLGQTITLTEEETDDTNNFILTCQAATVCQILDVYLIEEDADGGDDIDINTSLGSVLLHENRRVDRAGEGRVGRRDVDLQTFKPGLFQMKLGLVRIIAALLHLGVERHRGSDRVVVPQCPVPLEDLRQELLAIYGVFEREPDVVVVERR